MPARKQEASVRLADGRCVVKHLEIPRSWWMRGVGLLGRKGLPPSTAMLLAPCGAVHTFGMRFTVDILFLDREGLVVHVANKVRPGRVCGPIRRAQQVLEMGAGTAQVAGIEVGTELVIR